MKTRATLVFALLLIAAPAFAQKITIDYAHDYDFDAVKTFQYVDTKDTDSKNELMDARIRDAIIRELEEGGLQQVDADPDLNVTYHITTKDNTVFTTTGFGYGGWGPGWGTWGGVGMTGSTTTASTYTMGTLIIDAYEPAENKLVWRGTGTVTVKSKPEKQMQQVDRILAKMGAKWDKILAKQGK
jgi:hypothetical protein